MAPTDRDQELLLQQQGYAQCGAASAMQRFCYFLGEFEWEAAEHARVEFFAFMEAKFDAQTALCRNLERMRNE